MKPAPLLLTLPFLFPVYSVSARPLAKPEPREDGIYEFRDRGRSGAKFRIAKDELHETAAAGGDRKRLITAKDKLRSVQKAARDLSAGGKKMDLVAYEEGKPQTETNRRLVTAKVSVTLAEGIDPTTLRHAVGAIGIRDVFYVPRDFILEFPDATEALTAAEALRAVPGVINATVLLAEKQQPRYIPNDEWFNFQPGGTYRSYANIIDNDLAELVVKLNPRPYAFLAGETRVIQWYFDRESSYFMTPSVFGEREDFIQRYEDSELPPYTEPSFNAMYYRYLDGEIDLNVIPAWDLLSPSASPIDGTGVRVAIMDDGVFVDHPDFKLTNVDKTNDRNFLDGTAKVDDPTPPFLFGFRPTHGTSVAGLILAERDNNIGISGVAPDAKMVAYRMIGGNLDDATFADAMVWGAELETPRVTATNPDGLYTGNEWRRGQPKFDISNNSWGPSTGGSDFRGQSPYFRKALAYGVTVGRMVNGTSRGIIYVMSAGNDGEVHGDVNMDYLTNSIYTLTVGGISDLGRRISYSTPGAALNVVAPTGGNEMQPRVKLPAGALVPATIPPTIPQFNTQRAMGWTVTPDEYDEIHPWVYPRATQQILTLQAPQSATAAGADLYNQDFSGTSASGAFASGVVALMLEANPDLGWRDVQEIIMRSAVVVDPLMGEWEYNHLGMPMSHKYGAGLIDAHHAVRMAQVWRNLGPRAGVEGNQAGTVDYKEVKGDVKLLPVNSLIPDNDYATLDKQGVTITNVPAPSGMRVEHVVVRLKVSHGRRGDLGVMLISPDSGQSGKPVESYLLVPKREDQNANIGRPDLPDGPSDLDVDEGEYWDFMTVRHWGTSLQNPTLLPTGPLAGGNWTLKIWDNTRTGITTANSTAVNKELRVGVSVANPTATGGNPARLDYAAVIFHGTLTPSENLAPVIDNTVMIGLKNSAFQAEIRATGDNTPGPDGINARAPVYDYRIRVLNSIPENGEKLVIAPDTAAEYRLKYPDPNPLPNPAPTESVAHLRFDRETGLLTNAPYPELFPGSNTGIRPFKKLPKQSWNIELRATNIFGTTRRQIELQIRDFLTYSQWRTVQFTSQQLANPAISGDNADPDSDGLPNLLEYAVGGTPFIKDPGLVPTTTITGAGTPEAALVYTYKVDTTATGYPVIAEVSSLLNPIGSWTTLSYVAGATAGNIQTRVVTIPYGTGPRQFVRLRAGTRPTGP